MTNQEKLENWIENEKKNNNLVDIKFCPGNISQATVESFSASILSALDNETQNNYELLTENR